MLSPKFTKEAEKAYQKRAPLFGPLREEIDAAIRSCSSEEQTLLKFFYGTMPLSDAAQYPFSLFASYVRHGLMLRRTMPWCRDLPEEVFARYVCYYRVNSEKIEDCRPFFYEKVIDQVRGQTMEEAVIALNYFAAAHVTYRASDERTLSPLSVYRSGDGRCGEESAFFVSVLRSVGIPARQVYVPFWAHCDDNHAWCEVLLSDGWHYLGACEPEEVLDRGWFDGAASRAMLIHARQFDDFPAQPPAGKDLRSKDELIGRDHGVSYLNRTAGYADTVLFSIRVTRDGAPAAGACVHVQILNYAEFVDLAVLKTDGEGCASIRLGKGTIRIAAVLDGLVGEGTFDTGREDAVLVALLPQEAYLAELPADWVHHDLTVPPEHILYAGKPDEAHKLRQKARLEMCRELREAEPRPVPFPPLDDPKRTAFLKSLSEKDRKDVTEEIFQDACLAENIGVPEEVYEQYVFSERIGREELSPWRCALRTYFTEKQKAAFLEDPASIAAYVAEKITYHPEADYQTLLGKPMAVLSMGEGNPESCAILCVAIARSLNLPARLDPVTGTAQWYDRSKGAFRPFAAAEEESEKEAEIEFLPEEDGFRYGRNWTIARFQEGTGLFQTLRLSENPGRRVLLSPGTYRLITASRDPSGNLHEEERAVRLAAGERVEIRRKLDPISSKDRIVHCTFEDFSVETEDGTESSFFSVQQRPSLAVFLEPGREPSEHVLNELLEKKDSIPKGLDLIFLLGGKDVLSQRTLQAVLCREKVTVLYQENLAEASRIARHLYVDSEKLPLLMLLDAHHVCLYGCSGYNVGSVALALDIAQNRF